MEPDPTQSVKPAAMPYPSPKGGTSRWMDELSSLVKQSSNQPGVEPSSGMWRERTQPVIKNEILQNPFQFQDKPSGWVAGKSLFTSLKCFPHL